MYTFDNYGRNPKCTGEVDSDHDKKETILLVEDDPALLKLLHRMLKNLNYQVITAQSAGSAIDISGKHPGVIHLLLTDVILPGMDGSKLAALLQTCHPNLKRLFMSGYPEAILRQNGVKMEGKVLQKPFTKMILAASIREILGGDQVGNPKT